MATWKKVLLEGGVTGTAPIDVTNDVVSLDLKSNGGLVVESDELAVDLAASAITGILAVGDGGTGLDAIAANSVLVANSADTLTAATASTDGHVLTFDTTNGVQWEALPASSNAFAIISPGSGDALEADAAGDTLNINGTRGVTVTGSNSGATDTLVISMDFAGLSGGALNEGTIASGDLFIVEDVDESTVADKQKRITAGDLQDFVLGGDNLVTQIIGTANQITASAATGDVTLSIPSAFVAPGSIASTSTITAATGLTVTDGGLTVSGGGASVTGNSTFANNVTITGDLTVNGTNTILNTETLTVDDDIIVINDNGATVTAQGGIQLKTTSTNTAQLLWNAASGTRLSGWLASPSSGTTNLNNYLSLMEFVDVSASSNPSGNAAGVGSFHFNTADEELYIRVA
tara:strand:- start:147 stop:1361 length:1215 start_codon:yes stop_codon:yes gene_type:complete